ncbi:MAG TPA: HAD family hydrolase [Cyanobacteria bacterium UBA10660]|nr:MAG TPA: HAD family hydrolase [Candidatus Gastranaerophilales bacterium HUM_1]HAS94416.1 HAD family hydrolase [Cyanobacteria bacterium UBA10660]
MKKTVIFDLDGTLLNTLDDLADSTNYALSKFGYPTRTIDEVRQFVGNGVAKLIERAIPEGKNNPNFEKCLAIFKENYAQNMYNKTAPYNGIIEMLSNLKSKGIKIAVVSNKFDLAVKELCKKYFEGFIDFAAGENEAQGIKKKPAPDTVISVLNEFNFASEDAVYVGDSDVDIMTAKNSKMSCISVTWGFRDEKFLLENGATILINAPSEIYNHLT